MYRRRRIVGTYLGAALAVAALPGISLILDDSPWELILCGVVFLVVNQLIHCYPSSVRTAPPVALLVLAAIGIVQDTLLWLLVSWIGSQMDYGVHVDGFLTALAGGAVMRLTVLAVMAIGPQPVPEAA
ncbi:hypothetical protein ACWC3X_36050 [Streptomyces populi]|jgi:putative membrane protein